MNVCFVTRAMPAHGRGGMEDHALALAAGVAARGHSVTVVTTGHDRLEVERRDGVEIRYLRGTPPRSYSRAWRRRSTEEVLRLHAERRFDVLHSQSVGAYDLLRRGLHRRAQLPAVVTFHGTPYDEVVSRLHLIRFAPLSLRTLEDVAGVGWWAGQYVLFYRATAAAADAVIATSDQQEELIRRIFRVAPERLHRVYNGMDLGLFAPGAGGAELRRTLGIAPETPVLLCVARFVRDKGLDQVIEALPAVAAALPDVLLLLVGDGEQRGRLERLARRRGVAGRVRFTGFVPLDQLPAYFDLCDLFVNATIRRNGYDLTMLEAMACGKVVVSSDVGSTPTLIRDGVDGLLVPVGNPRALAERVVAALRSPERLREMGRRAREKARSGFDLDAMVEGTLGVYEAVRGVHARP